MLARNYRPEWTLETQRNSGDCNMKFVQKTLAAMALAGIVMAQPIQARESARVSAATSENEELAGGGANAFVILGIFAGLLLLAEVTGLIDVFGNDDDLPTSP
jgi:hypothetical protein